MNIVTIPRQVPSTVVVTSMVISVDVVVLSFGVLVVVGRRGVENKVGRRSVVVCLLVAQLLDW